MANILIIDDEAPVRGYRRRVLTAAGHTVRGAADGKQGLAAVRAQVPDLIVCDLFMPGAEGIETIRALRGLAPAAPMLVISGGGRGRRHELLADRGSDVRGGTRRMTRYPATVVGGV